MDLKKMIDKYLTDDVLVKIHNITKNILKKMGYNVNIKEFCYDTRHNRIKMRSDSFDTTPNLFRDIFVTNGGGNVRKDVIKDQDGGDVYILEIWLPVNLRWKNWSLGSNGCELFDLCLRISESGYLGYTIGMRGMELDEKF